MSIRVRYAPSPTGLQHIGGVRSALFDYFFARSMKGTFILRIEDTDQTRTNDESIQDLYDTFEWLGIEWDEGPDKGGNFGPYIQTKRADLYKKFADELVQRGAAYHCYCTQERMDELRKSQGGGKKGTGYDLRCRNLTPDQRNELESNGAASVIRYKVPLDGRTTFNDAILGEVSKKNRDIPADPIIMKSDGLPTYHLAVVVDDHHMEITHALRGQEWLPSAPLHILLYASFGWQPPVFCHLPLVMGKDGQKLSKRHGSTSMREFKNAGYLPEAIINYLSLLGWSFDDQREFFTKDELEELFTLEKLNKAPAVFDYKKLEWFNGQYIRKKSDGELKKLLIPYLENDGVISNPVTEEEEKIMDGMMPLVKERLRLLPDISNLVRFLFHDILLPSGDVLVPKRLSPEKTLLALKKANEMFETFADRSDEENEEAFRDSAAKLDIKLGDMLMPLRVAITGSASSPPLFASIRLLGVLKSKERVGRAIALLEKQ